MEVLPLSFQADTHHSDGSDSRMGNVAAKYSKKSGDMSRSSAAETHLGGYMNEHPNSVATKQTIKHGYAKK